VIAMVALPISALTLAAVVIRTAEPTADERAAGVMGRAEISVEGLVRPARLLRVLPAGSRLISIKYEGSTQLVGGTRLYLNLQEPSIPASDPVMRGLYQMVAGRAPKAPDEIALSPDVIEQMKARLGVRLEIRGLDRPVRVTGVVIEPESLGSLQGLTGPGTMAGHSETVGTGPKLVDLPPEANIRAALRTIRADTARTHGITRAEAAARATISNEELVANGISFGATTVALFGTGLVAAAAFAVGFRRQLRTIGLIGAAGGDPAQVRATVLFGGVTLGLAGSVAGILLGLVGAFALHPNLDSVAGRIVGPLEFPLPVLGGGLLLGTLAATGAAFAPARRAARLSTVDALAGHTPPPRPPGRLARTGLVLVGIGTGGVALATLGRSEIALGVGFVVILVGFLLAIPLLVEWVGKLAGFLPTSLRLAARQTARYGRRTGAAIAAATLALTLPVAVSAATLSEEGLQAKEARLGNDQLLVGGYDYVSGRQEPPAGLIRDLQGLMPEAVIAPLRHAVFPRTGGVEAFVEGGMVTIEGEGGAGATYRESGQLMIGTPDLLRAIDAEEGIPALAQGRVVAVGPNSTLNGQVRLHLDQDGQERRLNLDATEVDAPVYFNETVPRWLISAEAARTLGLGPGRAREWLLRDPEGLSGEEEDTAHTAAARYPGAYVLSSSDLLPTAAPYRLIATGISALIALAIVAVAVALLATESRRDHAIMVAVGAEPHTRRIVVGATAFLVAAMAAILAIPAGFLPVAVVQAARRASYPVVVPWTTMAVVLGMVPLIAAGLAAAASRQPKPVDLLQPAW
jgi:putative ABC transport system permease protein